MCSTPALLKKEKQLHLAVKYSDHPPALWVHTKVNTHILCIAALSFCTWCLFETRPCDLKNIDYPSFSREETQKP